MPVSMPSRPAVRQADRIVCRAAKRAWPDATHSPSATRSKKMCSAAVQGIDVGVQAHGSRFWDGISGGGRQHERVVRALRRLLRRASS